MAVGKPVVVSPVGMNLEVLNKGDFGKSAEKGEWFRELMAIYSKSSSERRNLGLNARKIVEKYYSLSANSLLLKENIEKLLGSEGKNK
jgi:glycosyltransferase involved in cell wall biosynthesis